jgi:hypothetical protein
MVLMSAMIAHPPSSCFSGNPKGLPCRAFAIDSIASREFRAAGGHRAATGTCDPRFMRTTTAKGKSRRDDAINVSSSWHEWRPPRVPVEKLRALRQSLPAHATTA